MSLLTIPPEELQPLRITFSKPSVKPPVFIAGTFTNPPWTPVEMDAILDNASIPQSYRFHKSLKLTPGEHQYKFRIGSDDTAWVIDDNAETIHDGTNLNNWLVVFTRPRMGHSRGSSFRGLGTDELEQELSGDSVISGRSSTLYGPKVDFTVLPVVSLPPVDDDSDAFENCVVIQSDSQAGSDQGNRNAAPQNGTIHDYDAGRGSKDFEAGALNNIGTDIKTQELAEPHQELIPPDTLTSQNAADLQAPHGEAQRSSVENDSAADTRTEQALSREAATTVPAPENAVIIVNDMPMSKSWLMSQIFSWAVAGAVGILGIMIVSWFSQRE